MSRWHHNTFVVGTLYINCIVQSLPFRWLSYYLWVRSTQPPSGTPFVKMTNIHRWLFQDATMIKLSGHGTLIVSCGHTPFADCRTTTAYDQHNHPGHVEMTSIDGFPHHIYQCSHQMSRWHQSMALSPSYLQQLSRWHQSITIILTAVGPTDIN